MPQPITEQEFQAIRPAGRPKVYDWDKLVQPGYFRFTAGEDFACQTVSFANYLRVQVAARNMLCSIAKVDGDLYVHIYPKENPNEQ